MDVSIGIISYNDTSNIGNLVDYFCNYSCELFNIREIYVVSTLECPEMVADLERFRAIYSKLKCLYQERRKGKTSAVNLFLIRASSDILVLCSADLYPQEDTLEKLLNPFKNPNVGMTGGHVIVRHHIDNFISNLDSILWELHHQIALSRPKLGEMIAFRNVIGLLPEKTSVDEAYIEYLIQSKGYSLCYVPHAIIYNYGYTSFSAFVSKRIRINLGHRHLRKQCVYSVSTAGFKRVSLVYLKYFLRAGLRPRLYLLVLGVIEVLSRVCAFFLFHFNYENFIWNVPLSKKYINGKLQG